MTDLRYDLFLSFLAGVMAMAVAAFLAWRRVTQTDD